jgi:hypothetical protein
MLSQIPIQIFAVGLLMQFAISPLTASDKKEACSTEARIYFKNLWNIKKTPRFYGLQEMPAFDSTVGTDTEQVYFFQAFRKFQMFSLFLDKNCKARSVRVANLTLFERTAREKQVSLVVFWSPHSGIDENNFSKLIELYKKFSADKDFQLLLLADPLANKDIVRNKLLQARLRSIDNTKNNLASGFQNDNPEDKKIKTFLGNETSLLEEIPLCQFPITFIWKNEGNLKLVGEWIGEFPQNAIEKKVQRLIRGVK